MSGIEMALSGVCAIFTVAIAALWRSLDAIHKRIDARDSEIKALDMKMDAKLDDIRERLIRIETKNEEREKREKVDRERESR